MTTTLSMWLGIAFVVLAIAAVLLQAWLWNPKYWDAETKRSHAPRFWMWVHRIVGYAYGTIYVVMMIEMVPRLWQYQIELPARTVVHATMAIAIGVILIVKLAILRFFRWFEEAMPVLGLALLVCTIVLATFSVPFALRAHGTDEAFSATNRERVRTILHRLEDVGGRADQLCTEASLRRGREVVVQRCAQCHDLRTVLASPRTGSGWLSVCRRMQDKPTIDRPISDDEVLLATAYLVAITPSLQESVRRQREENLARDEAAAAVGGEPLPPVPSPPPTIVTDAGVVPIDGGVAPTIDAGVRRPIHRVRRVARVDSGVETTTEPPAIVAPPAPAPEAPAPFFYSTSMARQIVQERCTECHGADRVESVGGADPAGWSAVVRRMIARGAELDANSARMVVQYLAQTYPPS